jgi:hypothetical protein
MTNKKENSYIDQLFEEALQLSQSEAFQKEIKDKIDLATKLYSKDAGIRKKQASSIIEQAEALANSKEFQVQIKHKIDLAEELYLAYLANPEQIQGITEEAIDRASKFKIEDLGDNRDFANDQLYQVNELD